MSCPANMLGVMCAIRLKIQGVVILPACTERSECALTQEGSEVRARFHFSRGSCGRANAVERPLFDLASNL